VLAIQSVAIVILVSWILFFVSTLLTSHIVSPHFVHYLPQHAHSSISNFIPGICPCFNHAAQSRHIKNFIFFRLILYLNIYYS
jgi:hypothetical protein